MSVLVGAVTDKLAFPVEGYTPWNAPITAVLDHEFTRPYESSGEKYGKVRSFEDEEGSIAKPDLFRGGLSRTLYGYAAPDKHIFLPCLNYYQGRPIHQEVLYYDGHPGYDYSFGYDTEVFPAISGYVSYKQDSAGGDAQAFHVLQIDPRDGTGITVYYLHLSTYQAEGTERVRHWTKTPQPDGTYKIILDPKDDACPTCAHEGDWVDMNDRTNPIALTGEWGAPGAEHLHFEVHKDAAVIDPYGDRRDGVPSIWLTPQTASCLQVGHGVEDDQGVTTYEVRASHFSPRQTIQKLLMRPNELWSNDGTTAADDSGSQTWTVSTRCSDKPGVTKIRAVDESKWLRGDFNNDRIVNSLDYSLLNQVWFTSDAFIDINRDGRVNSIDYSILNANWFREAKLDERDRITRDLLLARSPSCG